MIGLYIAAFLVFLLLALFVFSPLRAEPRPFPENPRPEELRLELEGLKQEAKEVSGPERIRILKRIAWIERELGVARAREAERAAAPPRRFPALALVLVLLGGAALAAVLVAYTLPRLPGGLVTEARAVEELQRLKELEAKAERANTPEAWLAYADLAFELRDLERAARGYTKVIELDHKNLKAYRRYGMILFMAGQPKEAAQVLAVVTRVDPNPEGLLFLGNAYFQLGEYAKAITAWQGYLQHGGEARERVQNLIATARARMNAKDPGERIYAEKCAACHGAKAEGGIGPRLARNPILNAPDAVAEIVKNGRGGMPAIPLTAEELKALLGYLRKL